MTGEAIPEDVIQTARERADRYFVHDSDGGGPNTDLFRDFARAILAERERCARIADEWSHRDTGRAIAEAIRVR